MIRTPLAAYYLFLVLIGYFLLLVAPDMVANAKQSSNNTVAVGVENLSTVDAYNQGVHLLQAAQTEQQRGEATQAEALLQQAETAFRTALKANTSSPALRVVAQSNLGYVQLYRKAYPQAIQHFKQALKLHAKHLETLSGLAMAYVGQQQAEKAVPLFQQLTQLQPQNPNHWFNLGSTNQCLNLVQQAEQAYAETLKLSPKHQATLFNLATLKENTLDYKEAIVLYDGCIRIDASSLIGLAAAKRSAQLQATVAPRYSTQP